MIVVSLIDEGGHAEVPPKAIAVAPVKPVPVIVTMSPPVVGPDDGETFVTDGTGAAPLISKA
jgi:hypothetical protein